MITGQTFRNWAGTSTVVGAFEKDFLATLQDELKEYQLLQALLVAEHNVTMELVLKGKYLSSFFFFSPLCLSPSPHFLLFFSFLLLPLHG